jgi:hypothetical protein
MSDLRFYVYRLGSDNILRHECSGTALGTGRLDLGFIVDGMTFEVVPGDVVELGENFLVIDGVSPGESYRDPSFVEYHYLPFSEDHDHIYGDGPWSHQTIARLRREALGV